MQVICTDGTVLQCQRFRAIDSGVLLFDEQPQREASEDDEEEEETEMEEEVASAFVPLHQLRFVLPEGVQPGRAGTQSVGQATPGQQMAQTPPTGPTPSQGQIPSQQPMGGQPSTQQQPPGQQSQPGTDRRR